MIVPRPILKLLLIALAMALAQLAYRELTLDLMAYLSGVAAPFCMFCATAIWAMRDKVDSALDPDYLGAAAFRASRVAYHEIRNRSMYQAAVAGLCALAAMSPAISKQLTGAIWNWMMLLGGAGVARAAYGYLLAAAWEKQLIEHRHKLIQSAKDAEAQAALERSISATEVKKGDFPGWTSVGGDLRH